MVKEYYICGKQKVNGVKMRAYMKKYLSFNGKPVREAYVKKHREEIRKYNKAYLKKLRATRKVFWLCASCGHPRTQEEKNLVCNKCKKANKIHMKKFKNKFS